MLAQCSRRSAKSISSDAAKSRNPRRAVEQELVEVDGGEEALGVQLDRRVDERQRERARDSASPWR